MKRGAVTVGYLDAGQWSASFGLSYRDLCLFDAASSRRIVRPGGTELRQMCGTGGIAEGRNEVARAFLDTQDAEWLWFVDTDMGFRPDTVDRLVASADRYAAPVMGGLCFALRRTSPGGALHAPEFAIIPTCYSYAEMDDEVGFLPMKDYGRDQVIKVAGTGAACLLIHRDVLTRVREQYGPAWFDPITHPSGYRGGRRVFSEDLSFCVRLAALDVPVHVNTAVKTSHEKGGVYLTEDAYDKQMALVRLEAEVEVTGLGDRRPVRNAG
ncbi:hypothetical protein ACIBI0_38395 [Microbispora rosea]|uniref:hypothetical protein n=1 Tax=Microbispora rosea TaxID=58117 RepID=UPI0037B45A09